MGKHQRCCNSGSILDPLLFLNSKSSSAAVRTELRPIKAHVTSVRFDYNSKSSSAAVRTELRPVKVGSPVCTAADDDFQT